MRKENWVWLGVGLFTIIVMGIQTGLGIRDGDWVVSAASLAVCSICLIIQVYNMIKMTACESRSIS